MEPFNGLADGIGLDLKIGADRLELGHGQTSSLQAIPRRKRSAAKPIPARTSGKANLRNERALRIGPASKRPL